MLLKSDHDQDHSMKHIDSGAFLEIAGKLSAKTINVHVLYVSND